MRPTHRLHGTNAATPLGMARGLLEQHIVHHRPSQHGNSQEPLTTTWAIFEAMTLWPFLASICLVTWLGVRLGYQWGNLVLIAFGFGIAMCFTAVTLYLTVAMLTVILRALAITVAKIITSVRNAYLSGQA